MLMCAGSAVSQQRGIQAESPGVGSTESGGRWGTLSQERTDLGDKDGDGGQERRE